MKRLHTILVLLAALLVSSPLHALPSENAQLFREANSYYQKGQFDKAIKIYLDLQEREKFPEIFYNLGNAYYRTGNIGKSIAAYEKAVTLDPRNEDARHNLEFIQSKVEYRIKDTRNWYLKAAENLLRWVTYDETFVLFLLGVFLFILSLCFLLWTNGSWGWFQKAAVIFLFISGVIFAGKKIQTDFIKPAIVVEKNVEVHYGPSATDQVAFRLGEGLKVYVVDHIDDWSRIWLNNGETGWIENDLIEEVKIS